MDGKSIALDARAAQSDSRNVAPAGAVFLAHADNDETLIRLWLDGRPETTQRAYRADVRSLLAHVAKPLAAVTLGELQTYAGSLADLAPASRHRKLAATKSLYAFGHKLGYLPFDTARVLQLPRLKDRLAERIVTEAEARRLIDLEPNPRNQAALRLMYGCGLRISEVCGLLWRDLKGTKTGGQITVHGKGGKTRIVLVQPKLWRLLAALKRGAGPDEPVLRSRADGLLDASACHRIVKAAAKRAGLPDSFSAHWLRHAHASHSLDHGAPIHVLQGSLGHGSLTTTTRYVHARPGDGSALYLPE